MGVQFAHPDQAKVSQVWISVRVPLGERCELRNVLVAIERQLDQLLTDERQGRGAAAKMKCGFREHRFAGQQGLGLILSQAGRPIVMSIVAADESNQKARVSDRLIGSTAFPDNVGKRFSNASAFAGWD